MSTTDLSAKGVLITGSTGDLGKALSAALHSEGWELYAQYRSEEKYSRLKELCPDCHGLPGHFDEVSQVRQLAERLEGALGGRRLDALVLNAGLAITSEFESEEIAGQDPLLAQIAVDLTAPLLLLREILQRKCLSERASIVFISSNLARHGLAGKVAYAAAKSGLEGAVRGLAKELGPRGMRVNAVAPGLLKTAMTESMGKEGYESYEREVPLGRVGQVEDVLPLIQFLLSPAAAYISGQIIDVDGAWGC